MFSERLRSHHDVEHRLDELLGLNRRRPALLADRALKKKLKEKPTGASGGVYFHVPHCDKICEFCNLNRKPLKGVDLDDYTEYLVSEIKAYGKYPYIREKHIESVYFGGGTPTVLNAGHFERLLKALGEHFNLSGDCEITVESTQHNLGAHKASELAACGVNRFSIGIQTFSGRGRKLLGRTYSAEKAADELLALRDAFKGVLGIDIIYSYPDQSIDELRADARMCIDSGVDSVSFYSLMIHSGSSMSGAIERGELPFRRDINFDLERHNLFYETLTNGGFTLLELSKLARPGKDKYRYIHVQYEGKDLVPIGSGAGGRISGYSIYSMSPKIRFVSPPAPRREKYARVLGLLQFGTYDPAALCANLGSGAEARAASAAAIATIETFVKEGLLKKERASYTLSPEGIFWGNNMAAALLEALIRIEGFIPRGFAAVIKV
ncbi:MAG: radical SAM protein [Treponema sp.]|jgi:oxygen-independent coproporphyrinogen-3 oxidase|nr:radical SAM protein [Treponema sp.]